jgi:hypothetical protein
LALLFAVATGLIIAALEGVCGAFVLVEFPEPAHADEVHYEHEEGDCNTRASQQVVMIDRLDDRSNQEQTA